MYFIPFIIAFALAFVAMPLIIRFSKSNGLLSRPRARDVHKKPISRIGGVGILLSFVVALIITFEFLYPNTRFAGSRFLTFDTHLWGIIIGGCLISISMLFDDIVGLRASLKLLLQILAAGVIIASGIGIDTLTNPFGAPINLNTVYIGHFLIAGHFFSFSLWSDLLTLVWLVGMMNVMNFVDGVDGMAAGLSSIAAFIIFLLCVSAGVAQPATALVAIILVGSSLGFLWWNFPPAKIFMGDSGSMFLGFLLGVLPLISGGKLATSFLVLGFPIIDGLFVACGRIFRGKNPLSTPDKTHLHHRFLAAGYSPKTAVFSMYFVALAFGWVALRSTTLSKIVAAVLLVVLLALLTLYLKARAQRLAGKIE